MVGFIFDPLVSQLLYGWLFVLSMEAMRVGKTTECRFYGSCRKRVDERVMWNRIIKNYQLQISNHHYGILTRQACWSCLLNNEYFSDEVWGASPQGSFCFYWFVTQLVRVAAF